MPKRKSKAKRKCSLDSSCQIEKIKGRLSWVESMRVDDINSLYSPYYVLYEIKAGIINDWVNFYYLVEIEGPRKALTKWSDKYGHQIRKQQNINILHGLILEDLDRTPIEDKASYLLSIETSIYTALNIVGWNMAGFFGDFSKNEVVMFDTFTREYFEDFSRLVENNKYISFEDFVKVNEEQFAKLRDGLLPAQYPKAQSALNDVLANPKRADMFQNSKRLADSVIVIETPAKWHFVSKDKYHEIACGILGKQFIDYNNIDIEVTN